MYGKTGEIVILGAGLAGLSAAHTLSNAGRGVILVERDSVVGGLARTIEHRGFRFDLGGHRFVTDNQKVESLVKDILGEELLVVPRKSRIYLLGEYFDYPLNPANVVFRLGIPKIVHILFDYCAERVRGLFKKPDILSLEDWVVNQFGREMFELYFRQYSEKVWDIGCERISSEWVYKRIQGLSLWKAIKNAFFGFSGRGIRTLIDSFLYPRQGIGRLSGRLREEIERKNPVLTDTEVIRIHHKDFNIRSLTVMNAEGVDDIEGGEYLSSIPVTSFIKCLEPSPPDEVLDAVSQLKYRDLVTVTLMLDRERVSDLTWLYLPERDIPFGRIHEPKNWSPHMAPEGKTHIVAEFFCSKGDSIQHADDGVLTELTAQHLASLGFIDKDDIIGSFVARVPKAYPVFEVNYKEHLKIIMDYLNSFANLRVIGRNGMFRYLNMDHAMESGIAAAEDILQNPLPERAPEPMPSGVLV